jgi:predicted dehydrogenase
MKRIEAEQSVKQGLKRRDFVKVSASAGMGALLSRGAFARASAAADQKKRFANVGVGSRSRMYQNAIFEDYADSCEMVAFCDLNPGRLEYAQQRAFDATGKRPALYSDKDFDRMIAETKPDTVIVTTVDGFHHKYIIRAMELGCDVITEKPLTTTAEKCQQIIDAQKKTGRKCTVTFNYRYSPPRTQVKDLLMKGEIGDLLSVDFHWMLNTHHGADYFRRWHSKKEFSGGLMVHKATHHFDLVNWWLSAIPVAVFATGKREFYTPQMAKRLGLNSYHERCLTCPEKAKCAFELDLERSSTHKALYLDNEKHDGYYRDRCVFRPDIEIEDTMNVLATYDNSVTLCYSLNAFNAWEGYTVVFNGTKGRIEHQIVERIYVSGTDTVQGGIERGGVQTRVVPLRGAAREVDVWTGEGGHGGGDAVLLADLFAPEKTPDKYLRAADQRSGAYSILTGVAANDSIASGRQIKIPDLVQNIGYPDYPKMPSRDYALEMPAKL